jgi:hypothetical protein
MDEVPICRAFSPLRSVLAGYLGLRPRLVSGRAFSAQGIGGFLDFAFTGDRNSPSREIAIRFRRRWPFVFPGDRHLPSPEMISELLLFEFIDTAEVDTAQVDTAEVDTA